jgi:hypothetical protein
MRQSTRRYLVPCQRFNCTRFRVIFRLVSALALPGVRRSSAAGFCESRLTRRGEPAFPPLLLYGQHVRYSSDSILYPSILDDRAFRSIGRLSRSQPSPSFRIQLTRLPRRPLFVPGSAEARGSVKAARFRRCFARASQRCAAPRLRCPSDSL